MSNNLKLFGAYWKPDSDNVVGIYDLASLKKPTGKVFRYLNNMTNVDIQGDVNSFANDVWVYGGKMEKDITSVLGPGGQTNGATEPQNGDWTPVIKNAAALIGENLSDADIENIKRRIWIESKGDETIQNNWDSNAQAGHPSIGLVQFIQSTFDTYCRPPYTNIRKGLDQLIAMMNIPNWRQQIAGNGGWSPHGAPISKATIEIKPTVDNSWGWPFPSVGEGHFTGGQLFGVNPGGEFRRNGFHDGLDFGSIDHPGNEVHAIHGGEVKTISWGNGGINFYVVIQDAAGLNVEYQEAFSDQSNITVRIGQQVKTGDVIGYRTTDHLHVGITKSPLPAAFSHAFSNDGTWIDPLNTIKTGIANGGSVSSASGGDSTTSTTSETYYALVYHFENQESIDKYGRRHGPPITVDSIYDMNALKQYAENTIQYNPATTLTISGFTGNAELGEVIRLIAPERNLNTDMTLVGISGNDDYFDPNATKELTFNNTGLAMKDVNVAIMNDMHNINTGTPQLNYYGAIGARQEDHWANIKFNDKQMKYLQEVTKAGGEIKKNDSK